MKRIYLNDLLGLSETDIHRTKVRLNTNNGAHDPINIFKRNPKELLGWNYWNNKNYHVGEYAIGLVNKGNNNWLMFTIDEITGVLDIPKNTGVGYTFKPLEKYEKYFGRVIIKYHNKSQQMMRKASSIMDELEVVEILPSIYTGIEFPGYDKISLSYTELDLIINSRNPSYRNALENQKAVYVITDTNTGKLYVGSATSTNHMLLSRWKSYHANGHGGNVELKNLVEVLGFEYVKQHFQYSVIENYNQKVADDFILDRERYWKKVLSTMKHGYNAN